MGGNSLKHELLDIIGYSPDIATSSAFVQQRTKLKPEALKRVMDRFNNRCNKFRKQEDVRILAVDGSDIQIPTNPEDLETFFPGHSGQTPYNLLHLNAMYDLNNRIYTDVSFGRNEHSAFVDMVDSSDIGKALVIADRGYESYNNIAHVQEKGWYFLIRIKDGPDNGIKSGFVIPSDDEFDIPINLRLTRKQTNAMKELLKDRNNYRFVAHTTPFDFLPARSRKSDPDMFYLLSFRIVRVKINDEIFETLLTNLPADEYPPGKLKELYNLRWGIETSFRDIKYAAGMLFFHSRKKQLLLQEIYAKLILYNFSEAVTGGIVIQKRKGNMQYSINFTIAVSLCVEFIRRSSNGADLFELDDLISRHLVPVRPGRSSPRYIRARTATSFLYR
jgi:hypothetical protein